MKPKYNIWLTVEKDNSENYSAEDGSEYQDIEMTKIVIVNGEKYALELFEKLAAACRAVLK